MIETCRPLGVAVFRLQDQDLLQKLGWKTAQMPAYHGLHGLVLPLDSTGGDEKDQEVS